jgi:hypothetical protein
VLLGDIVVIIIIGWRISSKTICSLLLLLSCMAGPQRPRSHGKITISLHLVYFYRIAVTSLFVVLVLFAIPGLSKEQKKHSILSVKTEMRE